MSENGIEKIENLQNNLEMTTLDLAYNKIINIENLNHLELLTDLWVTQFFPFYKK